MKKIIKEITLTFLGGIVLAVFFLGAILISNYLNYGTFLF